MNILVLEDDPVSLHKLSSDLKGLGHVVYAGEDPIQGLEIFTKIPHLDLIITDLKMPFGGGEDFIKDVRNVNKDIPIIVVTGTIDKDILGVIKKFKCKDILVKPYSLDRLKSDLDKL